MIITLTWSQSKSTKTMLKRCESSWERTTFALEVRLDELREQPWCSSHTQSNPLQSYSFFLLSSTGPNGYPIPAGTRHFFQYPTRFSFENHWVSGNPKYRVFPIFRVYSIIQVNPNIGYTLNASAGNLQLNNHRLIGWFEWLLAWQNLLGTLCTDLLEKSKSKSFRHKME